MGAVSRFLNHSIRKLSAFGLDRRGQVALTFGLAALPIMGVSGIAVDIARKSTASTETQAAIDGAAIAAAAALNAGETQAKWEAAAQDFFDKNKPDNLIGTPQISVVMDPAAGTLVASTTAKISTTMMKVLGIDTMDVTGGGSGNGGGAGGGGGATSTISATVSLPTFTREHRGEIVMVMDYSGSMGYVLGGQQKYITMRNEAAKLVSALSQAKTNQYVKFGVVPFSSEVFATMPGKYWTGYTGNSAVSFCSRDRYYPHNLKDTAPNTSSRANNTKFGQVKKNKQWVGGKKKWVPVNNANKYHFWSGYNNYRGNCSAYSGWRNLELQDLTSNHNDTYNKILAMRPYGGTHIAAGMEFGYHVLSPSAPFTNGVAYGDTGTEKALILLTDGQQTTAAFGNGGSYNVSNGEANLATLCTNAKNSGIRILTISYDLYNYSTEQRLKNCASSVDDFYDADTRNELVEAFSGITAKLARDMFLSK